MVSGFCKFGRRRGWFPASGADLSKAFILAYQGLSNLREKHGAHINKLITQRNMNIPMQDMPFVTLTLSAGNLWTKKLR